MRSITLFTVVLLVAWRPAVGQQCRADFDGSGAVEINELIAAVNEALGGCGGSAATPTRRVTPTRTPTSVPDICPYKFNDTVGVDRFCGYSGTTSPQHCAAFQSAGGWTTLGTTVIGVFSDGVDTIALDATRTNPTTARVTGLSFGPNFDTLYEATGSMSLPSSTRLSVSFNAGSSCGTFSAPNLQFYGLLGNNAVAAIPGAIGQLRAQMGPPRARQALDGERIEHILELRDALAQRR